MRACRYENRSALKAVGRLVFAGDGRIRRIHYPALDLVEPNDPKAVGQRGSSSLAEVVGTRSRRQRTVQLLEHTLRLREELSFLCSISETLLLRSREAVAQARLTRQA